MSKLFSWLTLPNILIYFGEYHDPLPKHQFCTNRAIKRASRRRHCYRLAPVFALAIVAPDASTGCSRRGKNHPGMWLLSTVIHSKLPIYLCFIGGYMEDPQFLILVSLLGWTVLEPSSDSQKFLQYGSPDVEPVCKLILWHLSFRSHLRNTSTSIIIRSPLGMQAVPRDVHRCTIAPHSTRCLRRLHCK